jgi:outer membrane protein OmpA-like peptidoglycan-associated protein
VGNQPVLLESSKPELPKILRFMQQNPGMKIEIAGHVNFPNSPPVSKDSWEFKLSEERSRTVYDYLSDNGIPKDRISWKGYGNFEMREPNAITEADQAKNRRVELRVLESGCE